jgi:Ser/Thr protein kinase RdoA (MazF antagonist)
MNTSNLSEHAIAEWLSNTYGLANVQCKHLRDHSNHTYEVAASTERFILKLYGEVRHTDEEILWEAELLGYLAAHGASVAKAILTLEGDTLTKTHGYAAVLFEYAPGSKPVPPFERELYYNEGHSLALVHKTADSFASVHSRTPLDLEYLVKGPTSFALSILTDTADKQFLEQFSQEITQKIENISKQGLDFGPIHGDVTLDNFHIDEKDKITWYDFDSGGPGWRAYDLQGWALLEATPDFLEKHEAFLKGYQEVRHVSAADLAASPYLFVASEFWGLGMYLKRQATEGLQSVTPAFIDERIADLRKREQQLRAFERRG